MFTEILKIIPKLDSAQLAAMERSLRGRFTRVAKSFGSGLMNVLKGGGWAGTVLLLVDKLLNPLKEVQETIDNMLKTSDDVVTNAKQFGSSAGELFKLQKFAQASGLDAEGLSQLIVKFQTAVAESAADPTKQTSVKGFAGETNMVTAFFAFIQELKKMDPKQQILVQQEVFGEKQILKMSEFLHQDFTDLQKKMGLQDASVYDPKVNKLGDLSDLKDLTHAANEADNMIKTADVMNKGIIVSQSNAELADMAHKREQIKGYENLQSIETATKKLLIYVDKGVNLLGAGIGQINKLIEGTTSLQKIANSPMIRRWMGIGRDGK